MNTASPGLRGEPLLLANDHVGRATKHDTRGERHGVPVANLASRRRDATLETRALPVERHHQLLAHYMLGRDNRAVEATVDHPIRLNPERASKPAAVRSESTVEDRRVADLARHSIVGGDHDFYGQRSRFRPIDEDVGVALPTPTHLR